MNRNVKIRVVKGLLLGTIGLEELEEPGIEIWIKVIDTDSYRHFKADEILSKIEVATRK